MRVGQGRGGKPEFKKEETMMRILTVNRNRRRFMQTRIAIVLMIAVALVSISARSPERRPKQSGAVCCCPTDHDSNYAARHHSGY